MIRSSVGDNARSDAVKEGRVMSELSSGPGHGVYQSDRGTPPGVLRGRLSFVMGFQPHVSTSTPADLWGASLAAAQHSAVLGSHRPKSFIV